METMTFLNTDIEGSTSLLRRVGDQVYATILEDHHRIIREQLAAHEGSEHGTAGDSFFAVFTSPSSCVNAVVAMQTALQSFPWPAGETVRVRMGIHTGEVSQNETGFVGYEVHRAARISAIGHGGQVLLSSSTASLVEDTLASGLSIKPLGSHRLKDLGRPEAISQLVFPGAEADFPALRSLDNPELPNNLPTSLNEFVGRESDLQEIRTLINEARLVTLTGAGGSGKTRLALQVAAGLLDASRDGIWFVELAPVNDPAQVPQAIISALSLSSDGDKSATDLIVTALKEQNAVFVIDNCEHLVESVADLLDVILRQCPKVRLLATSREPLGVSGEEVYRVRSLTVPESGVQSAEELLGADAATLFVQRGRSIDKSFQATDANASLIASICRRLDGIPLAIELAAARLSSMSIEDLHERLDQRFRLLTGGSRNALPRQQTLGAMVAWSYDLLNDNEKTVLRRLTVFVNGFDLRAAENVCSTETIDEFDIADILGSLVNKSLVIAERSENSLRYRLLETIRQYAADQLLQTGGESEMLEARMRHAHSCLPL
jgi:predicted ATPase/class 3 adenylate cyclase